MMLYVSLEQEQAVKKLFTNKGWGFKKPGKDFFSSPEPLAQGKLL